MRKTSWFTELEKYVKSKAKFVNESTISIENKGSILIQQKDGNHAYIFDMFYLPAMKNNLLSPS